MGEEEESKTFQEQTCEDGGGGESTRLRRNFLESTFVRYEDLEESRNLMGLIKAQSDHKQKR